MGLGKYECDYCEKQFQDTPSSRRRHVQGIAHQRAKAQWYQNVSSQSQHFPSTAKQLCNRFLRAGSCQFGDLCKYYHPKRNSDGMEGASSGNNVSAGSIPAVFGDQMLQNLPPSLWPPPEGGHPPVPFIDWG